MIWRRLCLVWLPLKSKWPCKHYKAAAFFTIMKGYWVELALYSELNEMAMAAAPALCGIEAI